MSKLKKEPATEHKYRGKQEGFAFGRENYIILIVGILLIGLGFIFMIGGGSEDPNAFSTEIFSSRRITVAPIICLIGFAVVVISIMKKPRID